MFGPRHALFAPVDPAAAPGGGGEAQPAPAAPVPAPPAAPSQPAPAAKPKTDPPAVPAEPGLGDLMKDPRILREVDRLMADTATRTAAETTARLKAEQEEAARLAQLTAEERYKQEATNAKTAATKASNEAAAARAENAFLRNLLQSGLQPQDELCEKMAWQAAQVMAGEGQPVTTAILDRLKAEKSYLFKSPAGAPAPANNPAAVDAARTLSTQPGAAANHGGAPAPTPVNAFDMTDAQWEEAQKKFGIAPLGRVR